MARKYKYNSAARNALFIGDVLNPHLHRPVQREPVEWDNPEDNTDTPDLVGEAAVMEAKECPLCHSHNGHSLSCPSLGVTQVLDLQPVAEGMRAGKLSLTMAGTGGKSEYKTVTDEHLPRCDCGHLFEVCDYPNCPLGGEKLQ